MEKQVLDEIDSTVLWQGDTIVLGSTIDAVGVAVGAAKQGLKTAIVTPDAMLGSEVSMCWSNHLPANDITTRVFGFCNERNASFAGRVDPVIAAVGFDTLVKSENITPFVKVMPVRPLKNKKGILIGVEVVGKSGRQAMFAENVVDVTPGRFFSYNYLGVPKPKVQALEWIGLLTNIDANVKEHSIDVEELPHNVSSNVELIPSVWSDDCFFKLTLATDFTSPGDDYATAAEASIVIYNELQEFYDGYKKSILVDIAPNPIRIFSWDINSYKVFKKFRQTGLHVMSTNIPGSEITSEVNEIVEQLTMFRNARKKLPKQSRLTGSKVKTCELYCTNEDNLSEVKLPMVQARVNEKSSILISGAGTGGIYAAIHAGGRNVAVTLLDLLIAPGGICTHGRINEYYHGLDSDMQKQIDSTAKELWSEPIKMIMRKDTVYHSLYKSVVFMRHLGNRRVNYKSGYFVFGCIKKGKQIESVLAANEDGYTVFPAEMFIDATGDGDLAVACGAEYSLGRDSDGIPQPYSYTAFEMRPDGLHGKNFDAGWVDPTDTVDYTRACFEGRALYKNKIEFTNSKHYYALSPLLGVRESRVIKGEVFVTIEDAMQGRQWEDLVLCAHANYDNHSKDMAGESDWAYKWAVLADAKGILFKVNIPLRALLPKEVDNLIMGAKSLSIDHDVQQLFRMQKDLFTLGQVVSTVCSIAIKNKTSLKNVDLQKLHDELKTQNLFPESAGPVVDDTSHNELLQLLLSKPEDVNQLSVHRKRYMGRINRLTIYRLGRCKAIPELTMKRFLNSSDDLELKISAAIAFVLNGCKADIVEDVLREGFEFEDKEELHGNSLPTRYRAVLAALESGSEKYLAEIESILYGLLDRPDILVCIMKGFTNISPVKAIPIIRTFLVKTENELFMFPMAGNPVKDAVSYRFIVELQAVSTLQQLGCYEESRRLSKYSGSNNLPIRRYVKKLKSLAENKY